MCVCVKCGFPHKKRPIQHAMCLPISKNTEMQVDFHTGTDENSDVAFHFQAYFGISVKINNRQNGSWNCEVASSGMPCVDGQPFELHISVLQNEYQVSAPRNHPFHGLYKLSEEDTALPGLAPSVLQGPSPITTPAPLITKHPLLVPPSSGLFPNRTRVKISLPATSLKVENLL